MDLCRHSGRHAHAYSKTVASCHQEHVRGMQEWMDSWKARNQHPNAVPPRLFTVGRLDVASTGLIFVTNDGESLYDARCVTSLHIPPGAPPLVGTPGFIPAQHACMHGALQSSTKIGLRPCAELVKVCTHLNRVQHPSSGLTKESLVACSMQLTCADLEALLGNAPFILSGCDALQASGRRGCSTPRRA